MIINDVQFNAELEDILQELIVQLRANGIELIQKQKEGPEHIQICCPYHNNGMERRPSAGIRKSDGIFHCFACGEVHSLPEMISYCFGYTEDRIGAFGWKWLLKNFATVRVEERKDVELDFIRDSADRIFTINGNASNNSGQIRSMDRVDKSYVSEEELEKYRYYHPYMYKRGLTDEIIDLFDIGYDVSTESLTFPIRDIAGNCLFVARRSVKTKFFHYPEGVEKPLYGLYELYKVSKNEYHCIETHIIYDFPKEVIVTESMLDALSFWTVGKYAVALNGLGNELQFQQLRGLPCRKIILATDMDERGLAARTRIRKNLNNKKLVTEYLFPEGKKDANDCNVSELLSLQEIF